MKKIYIALIVIIVILVALIARLDLINNNEKTEPKSLETPKAAIEAGIDSSPKAVRYQHPRLGFSFDKPEGYRVGVFPEGDLGETLVIQTENPRQGFQIFIYPTAESVELTPSLIYEDLPGTLIKNSQKILLDNKASGIMFESNNEAFDGASYEIWFVYNNNIYQISSYLEFADKLKQIVGTWRF